MKAWILIQEMEALQVMWGRQEFLSLPPEKWLKVLKEIWDRLQKLLMQPPPEMPPQELQRLKMKQELPDVLIKNLQDLLQQRNSRRESEQRQRLEKTPKLPEPTIQEPANQEPSYQDPAFQDSASQKSVTQEFAHQKPTHQEPAIQ